MNLQDERCEICGAPRFTAAPALPDPLRALLQQLRDKARWITTTPIEKPAEPSKAEQWVRLVDVEAVLAALPGEQP